MLEHRRFLVYIVLEHKRHLPVYIIFRTNLNLSFSCLQAKSSPCIYINNTIFPLTCCNNAPVPYARREYRMVTKLRMHAYSLY